LRERVSDLLSAKDSIGQATSAVGGALVGVEAIEDLTGQLTPSFDDDEAGTTQGG
ncbi:MAG: hypothetical protein HOK25_05600, partial [Rhodospirillaceae bacterium]|nr:hypothetical protein [Rhodospirillaceae bacterium]